MATTVVTGKSATFTFGSVAGTAQITTFTPDESRSSETLETLGGTAVTGSTRERTISVDFLFDGNIATTGGFYGACKSSFESDAPGTLTVDIDGAAWTGEGIVDGISTPTPADGAVTCTVTFKMSSWAYTAPAAI
jgi:hypothetical protein